jgi:predicted Zn-dependent protease
MRSWSNCPVLMAVIIVCVSGHTFAFERSQDPDNGVYLCWEDRTITFMVNENCSSRMTQAGCLAGVLSAMEEWNSPECSDLQIVLGGTTPRTDVGFDLDNPEDNINLILWQDSQWVYRPGTVAMTTVTYHATEGRIVDADLELNGLSYDYETEAAVHNALLHELGHMIGLDNSKDPGSVMFSDSTDLAKTTKNTLSHDDIDAICFVYPSGGETPEDGGGDDPEDQGGGCNSTGGTGAPCQYLLILPMILLFIRRLGVRRICRL